MDRFYARFIYYLSGGVCIMPALTLDIARPLLDRAMARAKQEFNRPICVAICDPQLTALPGGSVLEDESGTMIGAIGVSGLTSAGDQLITDFIAGL